MSVSSCFALFLTMIVLAIIPGPGVFVVVSRSLSNGFRAGAATSFGIVAGDYVYIFLALMGLSALAQNFNEVFVLIRYLGAAYLIWLGYGLIFNKSSLSFNDRSGESGRAHYHFLAGLVVTLSNPKAIFFYVSFFPAIVDLNLMSGLDILIVYLITTLAVGGVMAVYAYLASSGARLVNDKRDRYVRISSGSILIGSGVYLAVKSA